MKRSLIFGLILALAAGCAPQATPQSQEVEGVIATMVAATQTASTIGQPQPTKGDQAPAQEATGTPEPAASPVPTDTPTLTLTATASPTATITQTPTLVSGDPVISLGIPTFDDSFDGAVNFYLYEDNQSSYQIEDGQMVLIAKKANSYETWSLSWGDLKNFYLEVTGTFGEECSGKDRFGMIFRAPDTSQGYLISISCDGSFRLSSWDSDAEEYTTIKKWTSSAFINSGPGGTNRLGIKTKDSKLTGFINGNQVFQLNDSTFTKGRFGVMVAASDTPGFTAFLDRVAYWKLP